MGVLNALSQVAPFLGWLRFIAKRTPIDSHVDVEGGASLRALNVEDGDDFFERLMPSCTCLQKTELLQLKRGLFNERLLFTRRGRKWHSV